MKTKTENAAGPSAPASGSVRRVMFAIMVTPEDLDALREIFSGMDEESEAYPLAKRVMKAVHRSRRKLGFKWLH